MDNNTLYAASIVGRQQDYDDYIIKQAWMEDEYDNMIEAKANDACEVVYEKHGAEAYARCRAGGISCGSDTDCDAVFLKYVKSLTNGYKGTFADFKKRSGNLAAAGQLGASLVGKLLSSLGGGGSADSTGYTGEDFTPPKNRTGLYIGLGVAAAAAIGVAVYFARKN
jgi:hypothetical protein